jgi:hypothetical protein
VIKVERRERREGRERREEYLKGKERGNLPKEIRRAVVNCDMGEGGRQGVATLFEIFTCGEVGERGREGEDGGVEKFS